MVVNHGNPLLSALVVYNRVLGVLSEQENQTCGYLNRQGRLCGKCKPNHSISAYSYDIKCHPRTSSVWRNVVQYIFFAYLPLTIFLCIVLVFRISATSPAMNVAVLCCQLFSSPSFVTFLSQYFWGRHAMILVKFLSTLYGIWNLDFFRSLVPPTCLPLNTMQIMALDYLLAVYPHLLLACFYVLLTAYDRECRLVVRLGRPFLWCTARLRQRCNIRRSIIDAFATFFLLSYIKVLNVSHTLLVSTSIYKNVNNPWVGRFLFYDATVPYFGPQHMPYALLALLGFSMGVLFPLALLLYPMQWFQKCLNRCGLNCPAVQMFMQCFHGYYRDRTDGGRECRYFAAVYPAFRITAYIIYTITLSDNFYLVFILLCTIVTVAIVYVWPYKQPYEKYNKLDMAMISSLGFIVGGLLFSITTIDNTHTAAGYLHFGYMLSFLFSLAPLVYFTVKLCRSVKRVLVRKLSAWRRRQQGDYEDLSNITSVN